MRTLLAVLLLSPALAQAATDYKCSSVKYEDQIGGWLRFGIAGRNGSVVMEYWNGFPPLTLVDANLDNGKTFEKGLRFVSESDRHNGTVATIDVPADFLSQDKFLAKIDMRYTSPENGKLRISKYDLECVRH